MQILLMCMLFVVGCCIGSFVCCQARRLHMRTSKKKKNVILGNRSVCMGCHYQLKWYDNIPIISWLWLKGKCRKCGSRIGVAEILAEIGTGLGFVCVGTTIQVDAAGVVEWLAFVINIVLVGVLAFLAVYDGLYGELPVRYLVVAIICAVMLAIFKIWGLCVTGAFSMADLLGLAGAVVILGGLYLILYLVSKGKWVGDGDWLLGTAIGIALGKPMLALVVLFIANALACIVMMPMLKRIRDKKIHFGPFMVAAYIITVALMGMIGKIELYP